MAKLTRGSFLKQASVGAATIGAFAALPGMTSGAHAAPKALTAEELSAASKHGPLVAHVKDITGGEISLLVGTREVTLHNPELVRQLVRAAR
ncbi:MAG: hypothetical protein ACRDIE_04455 [Chloroflexota bacterium]